MKYSLNKKKKKKSRHRDERNKTNAQYNVHTLKGSSNITNLFEQCNIEVFVTDEIILD